MKKVNIILDETTILNFPFLWKLVKRYRFISMIIPAIGVIAGIYLYSSQHDIYRISMGFKSIVNESDSPSSAIASVLGEKPGSLPPEEVVASIRNPDFYQQLAEEIYQHPDFKKMNFNYITTKTLYTHEDIFGSCNEKRPCILNKVRIRVASLFSIQMDRVVTTKFYINVNAMDAYTAQILVLLIKKIVTENRVKTIRFFMTRQLDIIKGLADSKRQELEQFNQSGVMDKYRNAKEAFENTEAKFKELERLTSAKELELAHAKVTMEKTKDTMKTAITDSERESYERYLDLKKRVEDIGQDINQMEIMASKSSSPEDKLILNQLKKELAIKSAELRQLDSTRSVSSVRNFREAKEESAVFDDFKLKVMKGQLQKYREESMALKKLREKQKGKLSILERKIEKIKPMIEYLKLLDQKVIQLKLMEATIVSDFHFDKLAGGISQFKRTSLTKLALFVLFSTLFFIFVAILMRYFTDGRIYDEYEIEKNFSDLEIIGHTPDFN